MHIYIYVYTYIYIYAYTMEGFIQVFRTPVFFRAVAVQGVPKPEARKIKVRFGARYPQKIP